MKSLIAGAAALLILAGTAPAFAQDHRDQRDVHMHSRTVVTRHYVQPARPMHHRYYEGQNWNGHRITNRGGRWGYYQPRNGASVFINIPL